MSEPLLPPDREPYREQDGASLPSADAETREADRVHRWIFTNGLPTPPTLGFQIERNGAPEPQPRRG